MSWDKKLKVQARSAIGAEVRRGRLPHISELTCVECGDQAAERDHHLGYDREHWLDVEAVCCACHDRRRVARGETPRGSRHGSHTHPEKWRRGDQHWSKVNPERAAEVHRGEANGHSKYTAELIRAIRVDHGAGLSLRVIGRKYGINYAYISSIVRRKVWIDV